MNKIQTGAVIGVSAILVYSLISDDARSDEQYTTANDVYQGTGWKIFTDMGVYSIDSTRTYVVTYASTEARTKLQPMMDTGISQLRDLGIKIYNTTTIENVASTSCPPQDHFVIGMKYRPAGSTKGGVSIGQPCHNSGTHDIWSGKVWINSEYRQLGGTWGLSDKIWKNVFPHEFGHALGLDHAPAATNSVGDTPVMTVPNGGYGGTGAGKYTTWDLNGFRQLIANHD